MRNTEFLAKVSTVDGCSSSSFLLIRKSCTHSSSSALKSHNTRRLVFSDHLECFATDICTAKMVVIQPRAEILPTRFMALNYSRGEERSQIFPSPSKHLRAPSSSVNSFLYPELSSVVSRPRDCQTSYILSYLDISHVLSFSSVLSLQGSLYQPGTPRDAAAEPWSSLAMKHFCSGKAGARADSKIPF